MARIPACAGKDLVDEEKMDYILHGLIIKLVGGQEIGEIVRITGISSGGGHRGWLRYKNFRIKITRCFLHAFLRSEVTKCIRENSWQDVTKKNNT